jgi:hypothetical protein
MSTYFEGEALKKNQEDFAINPISRIFNYYDAIFDKIQFYFTERWATVGILSILYILRLFYTQGKL